MSLPVVDVREMFFTHPAHAFYFAKYCFTFPQRKAPSTIALAALGP
jgi:hypothetical protein